MSYRNLYQSVNPPLRGGLEWCKSKITALRVGEVKKPSGEGWNGVKVRKLLYG